MHAPFRSPSAVAHVPLLLAQLRTEAGTDGSDEKKHLRLLLPLQGPCQQTSHRTCERLPKTLSTCRVRQRDTTARSHTIQEDEQVLALKLPQAQPGLRFSRGHRVGRPRSRRRIHHQTPSEEAQDFQEIRKEDHQPLQGPQDRAEGEEATVTNAVSGTRSKSIRQNLKPLRDDLAGESIIAIGLRQLCEQANPWRPPSQH